MYVIDSNVFAKLFLEESDSDQAIGFFRHCIEQEIPLYAPTLLRYEVLQIARYFQHPLKDVLHRLASHCDFNLELVELDDEAWLIAEEIASTGHDKSGYPSLYDSCYHALAIYREITFITADKRHEVKAKSFGHLMLLGSWRE